MNPFNISASSKDSLGAVLTNPTELAFRKGNLKNHYPITDKSGKVWADVESAYKHYRTGDLEKDKAIMIKIIATKLRQYPAIVKAVKSRGGIDWLKSCSHIIGVRNSRWEGVGMESNFIVCLVTAYEIVLDEMPY
jgi:hypothetical protein